MKTIKEQIAPYFQALGKQCRDRRFYEANSVPWLVNGVPQGLTARMDAAGAQMGVVIPEGLPFEKQMFVLTDSLGGWITAIYAEAKAGILTEAFWFHPDGGWGSFPSPVRNWQARAELVKDVAMMLAIVGFFVGMLQHPKVHVAIAAPHNPEKSVDWTKAQEHYVFLHASHPVNSKGQSSSANYDEKNVLKRMAHWARGYYRTYRHPRYKRVLGQTRWVKEAWHGPDHWINRRSRQIYRWVDKSAFSKGGEGAGS